MARHLILGGARSGKSALANRLAGEACLPVCFIATARAVDAEMAQRIARHRSERPRPWQTIEQPLDLGPVLQREARPGRCIVIDCLTLWLSNCLFQDGAERADNAALAPLPCWERECASFLRALSEAEGEVLVVSNEVGLDIVPAHPLARRFRDEQGRLNQNVAGICDRVTLVVAGLRLDLKGGHPIGER